ncbi:MAG: hypothetical protein DRO73_01105 [Candidatus Thorarchaeota archaeon]|nr:MAG: hypothetical protein DRO73_01105 [Candidatus Thorarchaeota archaeon]
METEDILHRLQDILDAVEQKHGECAEGFERFQVALTEVLRLLSTGEDTLRELHGSPDAVKGYILRALSLLRSQTDQMWQDIATSIAALSEDLRK